MLLGLFFIFYFHHFAFFVLRRRIRLCPQRSAASLTFPFLDRIIPSLCEIVELGTIWAFELGPLFLDGGRKELCVTVFDVCRCWGLFLTLLRCAGFAGGLQSCGVEETSLGLTRLNVSDALYMIRQMHLRATGDFSSRALFECHNRWRFCVL
jgi:hypothetical protein